MAIINANDNTFHQEINGSNTVLVDFYADWCGPCKRMNPILESIDGNRNDIKIVKVNVDNAEKISQEFGVMSIPTIMVFKNGDVVSKKVGLCSQEELLEMIKI